MGGISMYNDDSEYLRSLKKQNNYHFTIPFEYIKKNYGNDNYDIGITHMERWRVQLQLTGSDQL